MRTHRLGHKLINKLSLLSMLCVMDRLPIPNKETSTSLKPALRLCLIIDHLHNMKFLIGFYCLAITIPISDAFMPDCHNSQQPFYTNGLNVGE